jgi:hypothetical protein
MHELLTPTRRRRLRDYIRDVGTAKKPELLKLLSEIDGDMQLITSALLSAYFDGRSAGEQIAMFRFSFGIHPVDLVAAFEALAGCSASHLLATDEPFVVVASVRPEHKAHGAN